METSSVLVVDPDSNRCQRLISIIAQSDDLRVIGTGEDILQACKGLASQGPPHVIVLNIDQPEMVTPDIWATIHLLLRSSRVVALTSGDKGEAIKAALGARVAGLHLLDVEPTVLLRAIRNASAGIVDYDPVLVEAAKWEMIRSSETSILRLSDVVVDLDSKEVIRGRQHIRLTDIEFRFLARLATNIGKVVSHPDLLRAVWHASPDRGGTEDQVLGCVKRLRVKIEMDPRNPVYIRTVRGKGYVLTEPHGS